MLVNKQNINNKMHEKEIKEREDKIASLDNHIMQLKIDKINSNLLS